MSNQASIFSSLRFLVLLFTWLPQATLQSSGPVSLHVMQQTDVHPALWGSHFSAQVFTERMQTTRLFFHMQPQQAGTGVPFFKGKLKHPDNIQVLYLYNTSSVCPCYTQTHYCSQVWNFWNMPQHNGCYIPCQNNTHKSTHTPLLYMQFYIVGMRMS